MISQSVWEEKFNLIQNIFNEFNLSDFRLVSNVPQRNDLFLSEYEEADILKTVRISPTAIIAVLRKHRISFVVKCKALI